MTKYGVPPDNIVGSTQIYFAAKAINFGKTLDGNTVGMVKYI
jgi:hypothetical protein